MEIGHMIKTFTQEGNKKLDRQYNGTKQAMAEMAREKVQHFMRMGDVGLGREEREVLAIIIAGSMMQGFALGYGLGKVEGITDEQIYL